MKLKGWLVMLTGMTLFLTILGIDSGLNSVINFLGLDSTGIDFIDGSFYVQLIAVLTGISIAGVGIGLFARSYDPGLVYAPFIVVVAGVFIKTFISLIKLFSNEAFWISSIVLIIFGGLLVGFVMACFDYFGNR